MAVTHFGLQAAGLIFLPFAAPAAAGPALKIAAGGMTGGKSGDKAHE